ncbi:MAG TPA: hypothetical protein VII69_14205 [Candidatus Eremiobacteraceae bacterium]
MNSIHGLVLRVAALVVGSATVGASIATNPATAQDVNSMLKALSITTCSTSGACKQFKNSGAGAGVKGVAGSGNGVIAVSTNGSATFSTSTNGDGIQSYSNNNDGLNSGTNNNSTTHPGRSGVWGHDDSTDGGTKNVGVAGSSNNGSGVSGSSTNGLGVFGISTNANGIQGDSTNGSGVYAYSANNSGGAFENSTADIFALTVANDASGGYTFAAQSPGGVVEMDGAGNVIASGTMYAQGFVTQLRATTSDGRHVTSYAAQSADAEMSDVGTGRIVDGRGVVQLDSTFARTLDMRSGYHVFLTPMGDSKGLYVASKSPASFEVRESQGGQSTLSFDYRIIGRAAGVTSGRLPAIKFSPPKIIRGHAPDHSPIH